MGNREIKFRTFKNGMMSRPFGFGEAVCFPGGSVSVGREFELMQYTGLKDANGVEIYEGDIVKMFYQDWLDKTEVIKFKDGTFGYGGNFHFSAFHCLAQDMRGAKYHFSHALTVIGNIYQHPELLNG